MPAGLITADPWQIIHLAREFGPAEVGRDTMQDPVIEGEIDGVPYRIDFYECYLGRACKAVLFRAGLRREDWEKDRFDGSLVAEWNRETVFGKAYLDEDGWPVLEMAVNLQGGVPDDNLRAVLDWWGFALGQFAEFVDY